MRDDSIVQEYYCQQPIKPLHLTLVQRCQMIYTMATLIAIVVGELPKLWWLVDWNRPYILMPLSTVVNIESNSNRLWLILHLLISCFYVQRTSRYVFQAVKIRFVPKYRWFDSMLHVFFVGSLLVNMNHLANLSTDAARLVSILGIASLQVAFTMRRRSPTFLFGFFVLLSSPIWLTIIALMLYSL